MFVIFIVIFNFWFCLIRRKGTDKKSEEKEIKKLHTIPSLTRLPTSSA